MVGESQIVVGTQIKDLLPTLNRNLGLLRTGYDTFGLIEPIVPYLLKLLGYMGFHRSKHILSPVIFYGDFFIVPPNSK
jgi:hypothetical protein